MYTILVKSDDTLVATQRQNIMHRSSLVRQLRFLVDPVYGSQGLNMADYVCVLEYRTPISHGYTPVVSLNEKSPPPILSTLEVCCSKPTADSPQLPATKDVIP